MEQSHVDTHLFSSCSPASPLERQQKQVNKGTCQSHARYVDGKEQAERIILGRSREDRERQGTQNRWIPRSWQQEANGTPGVAQPPDRVEISPRVFWKSRALPTPCSLFFPRKYPKIQSWDWRQATSFPLASAAPLRKGSPSNNHLPAEKL